MEITRQQIIALAEASFDKKGSVDVIELARDLNVIVYVIEDDEDFCAQIRYSDEDSTFAILVNKSHSATRSRFSIAHEIANYVENRSRIKKEGMMDYKGEEEADIEERADELAAEILMPAKVVNRFIKESDFNPSQAVDYSFIQKVSQKFNVSPLVAVIRLRKLKYHVPYIEFA